MCVSNTPPNWPDAGLHPCVLREAASGRLVLWVPDEGEGDVWLRVSSAPQTAVVQRAGLSVLSATAIRARRRGGLWNALARRLRRGENARLWRLPSGDEAEQEGDRLADLLLVWSDDASSTPDESRIRTFWPEATRVRALGPRLFLVEGVVMPGAEGKAEAPPDDEPVQRQAEARLAAARQRGDMAQEATALADLGLSAFDDGQLPAAATHLEAALILARSARDPACESDVLGILGLIAIKASRPDEARHHFEQALALSRSAGDRFAEKLHLERLATVLAFQGEMTAASSALSDALALAHTLGDRTHEADLLWHLAILHAEAGRAPEAVQFGQAAIAELQAQGRTQAKVYSEHLDKFRRDAAGAAASTTPAGYLRMAISASQAFGRFVVSGLKTVSQATLRERLRRCGDCEQYTGTRCRVCGCFIQMKARLPHEACSLGRWTAELPPN
jgi:tetratricopeptide (TPR) repeat protein